VAFNSDNGQAAQTLVTEEVEIGVTILCSLNSWRFVSQRILAQESNGQTETLQGLIIMVGDCGAQGTPLGIVGQFGWRTGPDGKKSSVLVLTQDGRTAPLGTLEMRHQPPLYALKIHQYSLIAPAEFRHDHIFLFLASMMVITANLLAVALGRIFDQSSQLLTTHPFTTSINIEIQRATSMDGVLVETFVQDTEKQWLVVANVVGGTGLQAWVMDEFYFLSFEWELGSKTGLKTSMTQGYGGRLTCQLLPSNTSNRSAG